MENFRFAFGVSNSVRFAVVEVYTQCSLGRHWRAGRKKVKRELIKSVQ